jgi:hypothetical protein
MFMYSLQPVMSILRQLDNLTKYLFDRLESNNLLHEMNILITADHGHTNVYTEYTIIDVEKIVKTKYPHAEYIESENTLFPVGGEG